MWDATLADTRGGEDSNDDTGRTTVESTDPVPRLEDTTGETEETADEAFELLDETSDDDNKLDEEAPAFDTASGMSGDDKSTAAAAGTAKSVAAKADKLLFVRRGMKEFEKTDRQADIEVSSVKPSWQMSITNCPPSHAAIRPHAIGLKARENCRAA